MTTQTRSPEEIERDIERDRAGLTQNLESLQDRFSLDTVVRQVGDQLRLHGGDMGKSVADAAKDNPIALALTGIGLAWLMFGSGRRPGSDGDDGWADPASRPYGARAEFDPPRRQDPFGAGPVRSPIRPSSQALAKPRGLDESPSWARDPDAFYSDDFATGDPASRTDRDAASTVSDRLRATGAAASDRVSAAGAGVADAARSIGASVSGGAARGRSMLHEGTETLSEEARARVLAAREQAIAARRAAMRSFRSASETTGDFYDRQPLAMGAIALAVGAAIGGAMPRTKTEDDLIGAQSDSLMAEAERIFAEEYGKAQKVAASVVKEAKDMATEAKDDLDATAPGEKTAVEATADRAESAADRLVGAAQDAAAREGLGKPNR